MRVLGSVLLLAAAVAAGEKELARDSGKQDGKRSAAGTGHVVSFDAPRGTWWIRAVAVHGARYGGGYDPATTTFTVTVCDRAGKVLTRTEAAYALFAPGRFAWVEVPLAEPVEAPRDFTVIVAFDPTGTKGVFVGTSGTEESHSGYGLPGGPVKPFDGEWMIRARLASSRPEGVRGHEEAKADPKAYRRDFDFLARTVRTRFPALKKKGVDWRAVCRDWRPRFLDCPDDRTHLLNVHRLLAVLDDMHTGVTDAKIEAHVPSFDGLYGAGLWIAADRGRLVLRAMSPGHPLAERLKPGAELLRIDGQPAKLVRGAVRRRLREWHGWSSTHFLDARLSFQFFPFGDKERLPATFLNVDGAVVETELERWGPGGRGLSRAAASMPAGVEPTGRAVAARLEGGVGYVRILGGMDEATQAAFFDAMDTLKGVDGILLDCRGMGGGGDGPAWTMAGRFFERRTPQGSAPALEPTGEWQYEGPLVLLQDARMVSSAETFTWALVETGRALSVGRPTGGATIIPTAFDAPSGLFSFRLGVHDRKTPIRGVQPEGAGTPPDVLVPCEPALLAEYGDPELGIARALLARWVAGGKRPEAPDLAREHAADFARWELAVCGAEANPMPDFAGARTRLAALPLEGDLAKRAAAAVDAWAREAEAQRAAEDLLAEGPPSREAAESFAKRWEGTRYARTVLDVAR